MGESEPVSEILCKARGDKIGVMVEEMKKDAQKLSTVTEKRLDAHAEDIDDLKKSQIQNSEMLKRLIDLNEKADRQIEELKSAVFAQQQETSRKKAWYESKSGERVVLAAVIALLLLVGTAVGVNIFNIVEKITF